MTTIHIMEVCPESENPKPYCILSGIWESESDLLGQEGWGLYVDPGVRVESFGSEGLKV